MPPSYGTWDRHDADPRPERALLRTGVYRDAEGGIARLSVVVEAERRLADRAVSPAYLPLAGIPEYRQLLQELVVGREAEVLATAGGTAAWRLVCELAALLTPGATAWVPEPGWPNHARVAAHAGLQVRTFPWPTSGGVVAPEAVLAGLEGAQADDLVLVHGCCHNPTGLDLRDEDWRTLAMGLCAKRLQPVIDVAFLGYTSGLEHDLRGARLVADHCPLVLWTISLGKTLRLYGERVGGMAIQGRGAADLYGHARLRVRGLWSSPPAHPQRVAVEVFGDPALRGGLEDALDSCRTRLGALRAALCRGLVEAGYRGDLRRMAKQHGLFADLALTAEQVHRLEVDHAFYLGETGGLNLSELHGDRLERLCRAAAAVQRG
jgi:aspartate aminotransferase